MKGEDDEDEESSAIGVSRYPVMPSLVALQQMRNRLQLAHLGRKLMKLTALATGKELRRLAMELDEASKSFRDDCKNAFILLARCRYCFPLMNCMVIESVPHHPLQAHAKLTKIVRTVTAVKCLIYTVVKLNRDPWEMLMVARGGEQCLEARVVWSELLLTVIHWLQLRACYQVAEVAHMSANKKHKVLGKVIIPRINDTIAYIQSCMEERAREEFFRMKKIIQVKEKRRKKIEKKQAEERGEVVPKPEELLPVPESEPEPPTKKPCSNVCAQRVVQLPVVVPDESSSEKEKEPSIEPAPRKLCSHVCTQSVLPPVVAPDESGSEDEKEPSVKEPKLESEPEPPGSWGALPSAKVGAKTILVTPTPPPVTPKDSKKGRPSAPVSSKPSVRITVPTDGKELVVKVSRWKPVADTVIKTTRSEPLLPSQPFPRTIDGSVCRICKSCRPRPQCKHKVFDGKVCEVCQTCCKTPCVIPPEKEGHAEVIILDLDGFEDLEPEEMMELLDSEFPVPIGEDGVSINSIGTIGDLSSGAEESTEPIASAPYQSESIYKIESKDTTTVRKITKADGTVIEQKEVTRITVEMIPEVMERIQSMEINEQIKELQKFLCRDCKNPDDEDPQTSKSVTASAADNIVERADSEWSNVKQSISNVCECPRCQDLSPKKAVCLCKSEKPPDPKDALKCSYEWSCGGEIPECSVRKQKKDEEDQEKE